jgi:hypothetical protein
MFSVVVTIMERLAGVDACMVASCDPRRATLARRLSDAIYLLA